jgi:hypothetical protein
VKQTKPTQMDLEKTLDIAHALSNLSSCNPEVPDAVAIHDGDVDCEPFDINDSEQCARVLEYLIDLAAGSSLNRVVFSCAIMMNPENEKNSTGGTA